MADIGSAKPLEKQIFIFYLYILMLAEYYTYTIYKQLIIET